MSDKRAGEREPLFHLSRRHAIPWWQAWGIRVLAIFLGMLVCGVVAFLLIEKLQQRPERIGDFYYAFIKGAFGTQRKFWKFLKNIAISGIRAERARRWWVFWHALPWIFISGEPFRNRCC